MPEGGGPERLPAQTLQMQSVTEAVYAHLRARILSSLEPDTPLRLVELAHELGVSTTPVRVAVERLRAEGLVVHRRGRGSRVAPLSIEDLRDIYAVRTGLEGIAAQRGAPRLSDGEVRAMRSGVEALSRLHPAQRRDRDAYLAGEWELHELCYRAAGHPRLLQEIRSYRRQTERYFRLALTEGINAKDDLEHQKGFFEACIARDPASAEARARELLEWTVERSEILLRRLPEPLSLVEETA